MTISSTGVIRRTMDTSERRLPEPDGPVDRDWFGPDRGLGCAGAVRVGRACWG